MCFTYSQFLGINVHTGPRMCIGKAFVLTAWSLQCVLIPHLENWSLCHGDCNVHRQLHTHSIPTYEITR